MMGTGSIFPGRIHHQVHYFDTHHQVVETDAEPGRLLGSAAGVSGLVCSLLNLLTTKPKPSHLLHLLGGHFLSIPGGVLLQAAVKAGGWCTNLTSRRWGAGVTESAHLCTRPRRVRRNAQPKVSTFFSSFAIGTVCMVREDGRLVRFEKGVFTGNSHFRDVN